MAYRFDPYDSSIVIDGFENGIADSPYSGFADMRNINTISIPGEASVNFGVSQISSTAVTGTGSVSSADAGTDTATYSGLTGTLRVGHAVIFSAESGLNPTVGTTYWIKTVPSATTFTLAPTPALSSTVNLSNGTGTFTVTNMAAPKHFVWSGAYNYMIDASGQVWTDNWLTSDSKWVNMGNKLTPNGDSAGNANGNGIAFLQDEKDGTTYSVGSGYLFIWRNSAIDYVSTTGSVSWVYGWNPSDGTSANGDGYLRTAPGTNNSHEARLMPTNQIVYCDRNYVGRFYQKNPATLFAPTTVATYVFDETRLLPGNDIANCLEYLGTNIMVGGSRNVIYPWNGTATTFNFPILCAENNIQKMVTINTNTYIFIGNRGRIYTTNGTNVSLYKKLPDHISGTVEPYFQWGGAGYNKNQLYFGALATTNAGGSISQYGGLWAIDVDTKALRLTNKLSYDTYAGYPTALIANFTSAPAGTGLYIGWNSGASTYGVDSTISTPYTGSQAVIDSDLIPIGTYQKPMDMTKVEYLLTRPLVSGESITIKTRLIFNTTDTGFVETMTDSTVGNFSNVGNVNFKNAIWLQLQIILNSTASSPSYVRLKHIRILGLVGLDTTAATQPKPVL